VRIADALTLNFFANANDAAFVVYTSGLRVVFQDASGIKKLRGKNVSFFFHVIDTARNGIAAQDLKCFVE